MERLHTNSRKFSASSPLTLILGAVEGGKGRGEGDARHRFRRTFKFALGSVFCLALLAGCAARMPRLDESFGYAVNMAKARQTLNPDASQNTDAVAGLDGQSANDVVEQYYKTFKAPPPPTNVFNIGIGGGGGGK